MSIKIVQFPGNVLIGDLVEELICNDGNTTVTGKRTLKEPRALAFKPPTVRGAPLGIEAQNLIFDPKEVEIGSFLWIINPPQDIIDFYKQALAEIQVVRELPPNVKRMNPKGGQLN